MSRTTQNYDNKAASGEQLETVLIGRVLQKIFADGQALAQAVNSLERRIAAIEGVEVPEGGYKPMQEPVASPTANSTAIAFIDTVAQDATGRMTATKKTVRTGSTSQTGVLQLEDSHTSTSTSKAATPKNVKEAYDLANSKQSPATTIAGYGITDAYTKTEVDGFLADKAEQVDVTNYTSFADIGAVIQAGNIPYYYHEVGSGAAKLYYQGTNVSGGIPPTVSQVFVGVFNGVLYETRFVNGASAFSAVVETPIFSAERVASSGESSSWSSDDTNVPTRAAVEAKISNAMSGSLGGFLGPKSPNDISLYQLSGHTFLKGDWFVVSESGSAYYYPNNDRSASAITLNMLEDEEYYWTTSGTFVKKPSTALQIYAITNLADWDDLNSTGLYQVSSQASNVQHSPSTGNCVCYVCEVNGAVVQFAISANHLYKRYRGGSGSGQWGSWIIVDNVEIIVGTTSFNDLKALYGMTKNLVAVGSETVSSSNYTTLFSLVSVKLSGSTPTEFIFERSCPHSAGQVGQVEQKVCTSSGWASALLNVKYSETSGTATNYNENVGSIKTALDGKIGQTPVGISSGSGVTNGAFFSAVLLMVLPSISDYPYNLGGNGMYISLKSFIEWAVGNTYKMQKGQIYAVLNNRGGTVRLYKGTSTDSDYISLDNDRIAFLGCWGLTIGTEYFLQGG